MTKIINNPHILSLLMAATALLCVTTALQANAAEPDNITYSHDSTMNALDHVLQRPLPSRTFKQKRFGDHLFLSVDAGPEWSRTNRGLIGPSVSDNGYRAAITVGDWVTPVHGWRLSVGGGRHTGVDGNKPFFGSLSADYMMNLSALLRNDNPSRRFELIGLIGVEGEALHRNGHKLWGAAGLRIGLQPRVYLTGSTYLYLEPRIGVFTDGLDDVKTWHRYDWNASLMIGLGYRLGGGRGYRPDNSLWISDRFRDNLFVGLGGGLNILGRQTDRLRQRIGADAGVFIGKWFTPASALRLSATGACLKEPGYPRRWSGIVDVDYMWNINSSMNGYDPGRAIEANFILGASGAYLTDSGTRIYPGLHAAVQGVWNVSSSTGIFIEPSLRAFSRNYAYSRSSRVTLMPSVNLGVVYRFRGTEKYRRYRNTFDYSDFTRSNRYFFEATGGLFMRFSHWMTNFKAGAGFGKWFTPESAWRVRGEYSQIKSERLYRSVTVAGDYMLSLFTLASGFDADRPFDIALFGGVKAGMAHYDGKNKFVAGVEAGLRSRIRVSNNVDILLEPSASVMRIPAYGRRLFHPEATMLAGVSYRIGRKAASERTTTPRTDDDTDNFVNVSIGPNLFSETMLNHNELLFTWSTSASAGHWFNNVSGLQSGISYDLLDSRHSRALYVGYFHVDYMLNLTGLFTGSRSGGFSLAAFAGPGIGWSNLSRKASPVGRAGIEARFRISSELDITIRPTVSIWHPRLDSTTYNNHHFAGTGTLPFGVSYRF